MPNGSSSDKTTDSIVAELKQILDDFGFTVLVRVQSSHSNR